MRYDQDLPFQLKDGFFQLWNEQVVDCPVSLLILYVNYDKSLWVRHPTGEREMGACSWPSSIKSYHWLQKGTLVVTLPSAGCSIITAGTGWSGVNVVWPCEIAFLICSFYLSVAECQIVWADLRYPVHAAWMLSIQERNKQASELMCESPRGVMGYNIMKLAGNCEDTRQAQLKPKQCLIYRYFSRLIWSVGLW